MEEDKLEGSDEISALGEGGAVDVVVEIPSPEAGSGPQDEGNKKRVYGQNLRRCPRRLTSSFRFMQFMRRVTGKECWACSIATG